MKNNQAIVNLTEKKVTLMFNNEMFTVDLTEGDLLDSWNSIVDKNDVVWDFNFTMTINDKSKPFVTLYPLRDNGDGTFSTNVFDNLDVSFKIIKIIGTKSEYYDLEFNYMLPQVFTFIDENDVVVYHGKKFNKAVDEFLANKKLGKLIVTDINGAVKDLSNQK